MSIINFGGDFQQEVKSPAATLSLLLLFISLFLPVSFWVVLFSVNVFFLFSKFGPFCGHLTLFTFLFVADGKILLFLAVFFKLLYPAVAFISNQHFFKACDHICVLFFYSQNKKI